MTIPSTTFHHTIIPFLACELYFSNNCHLSDWWPRHLPWTFLNSSVQLVQPFSRLLHRTPQCPDSEERRQAVATGVCAGSSRSDIKKLGWQRLIRVWRFRRHVDCAGECRPCAIVADDAANVPDVTGFWLTLAPAVFVATKPWRKAIRPAFERPFGTRRPNLKLIGINAL